MIEIRAELPEDAAAIDAVHEAAFGRTDEARLVATIRQGDDFNPELSRVAVRADEVVGHILFGPVHIDASDGAVPALALAPMGVRPDVQRQGIGTQLVRDGLDVCRRRGDGIVIVVGHARYYPRFGFEPAGQRGLEAPFPVPDDAFMVIALTADALDGVRGMVRYPPVFDGV
jgi:putative acetyltransferase